jgi:hypothetical protein
MPYRGDVVENTRVDRVTEGLDIEHAGPGGTGKARATLDAGLAQKGRVRGAKTVIDTSGTGITQDDSVKRAIASA